MSQFEVESDGPMQDFPRVPYRPYDSWQFFDQEEFDARHERRREYDEWKTKSQGAWPMVGDIRISPDGRRLLCIRNFDHEDGYVEAILVSINGEMTRDLEFAIIPIEEWRSWTATEPPPKWTKFPFPGRKPKRKEVDGQETV